MADNGNSTPVDQRHPECIQISNTSLGSKLGWDLENNMMAHFNLKRLVLWKRLKTYCEPRTLSGGCTFKIFLVDSNLMELCLAALSQSSSLSKNTNRYSASSSSKKNNLYILTDSINDSIRYIEKKSYICNTFLAPPTWFWQHKVVGVTGIRQAFDTNWAQRKQVELSSSSLVPLRNGGNGEGTFDKIWGCKNKPMT